ncbi:icmO (plasmid) [Thalassospira xiamenensis M-5 = DSM 17429]|uniref:IcmO n=2 Tax=Thalassospira xiamenensis TaxID=220697 RepID=A0AB72UIW2_9PROT|nr:icmO [Thalassospira xiamenensis M-5 = DSM 17429]
MGRDRVSGDEVWLSNDDARRHGLMIGTTGSGKTEFLLGLSANGLCWSSGFIFMDGKADVKLWGSIRSLARRFGRDDDLMILNFMQGGKETGGNSHTVNPFATTTTSMINNMLESLMPPGGGSNDMWQQRAQAFSSAVNRLMVDLRNQKHLLFNAFTLAEMMPLKSMVSAFYGRRIEMGVAGSPNHALIQNYRLSSKTREELQRYLNSLAGFSWSKAAAGEEQEGKALEQHGFLFMQFTKILSSLATNYDYIFQKPVGDIDLSDIVINRRILVVLLPSLEKSPDETANLGKINVALLKGMMATSLGDQIEGFTQEIIDNRPTTSMSPIINIFDEVGYYFVRGKAVMAAQARSLGFSLWFGAQDDQAMRSGGNGIEQEVNAVIANTNTKAFGKVEDPQNTYDLAKKSGGRTYVGRVAGYSQRAGALSVSNVDRGDVSIEEVDRISFDDLKGQREGQFHLVYGDAIARASVIYVPLVSLKMQRRSRFITVRPPEHALRNIQKSAISEAIAARISRPDWSIAGRLSALHHAGSRVTPILQSSGLDHVSNIWARSDGYKNPCERAAATLFALVFEDRVDWRANRHHFTEDLDGETVSRPNLLIGSEGKEDPVDTSGKQGAPVSKPVGDIDDIYVSPPEEVEVIEAPTDATGTSVQAGTVPQQGADSSQGGAQGSPVSFQPPALDSITGNQTAGRRNRSGSDDDETLLRVASAIRGGASASKASEPTRKNVMRDAVKQNFAKTFMGMAIAKAAKKEDESGKGTANGANSGGTANIEAALDESVASSDNFIKSEGATPDAHLYSPASQSERSRSVPINSGISRRKGFNRVREDEDSGVVAFDAVDFNDEARQSALEDRQISDGYADDENESNNLIRTGNLIHSRLRSHLSISETAYGLEAMRVSLTAGGERAFLRVSSTERMSAHSLRNVIADGIEAYLSDKIDPKSEVAEGFFNTFKTWKSVGGEGFTAEESQALVDVITDPSEIEGGIEDFIPTGSDNPLAGAYRKASISLWNTPETIRRVTDDLRNIGIASGRNTEEAGQQMAEIVAVAVSKSVPPSDKARLMPSGQAARDAVRARIGALVSKTGTGSSGSGEDGETGQGAGQAGEIVSGNFQHMFADSVSNTSVDDAGSVDALGMMNKYKAKKGAADKGGSSEGDTDLSPGFSDDAWV